MLLCTKKVDACSPYFFFILWKVTLNIHCTLTLDSGEKTKTISMNLSNIH